MATKWWMFKLTLLICCFSPTNAYYIEESESVDDVDCVVGNWLSWTACSSSCQPGGKQFRVRGIKIRPSGNGQSCPMLMQQKKCNEDVSCTRHVRSAMPMPNSGKSTDSSAVATPCTDKADGHYATGPCDSEYFSCVAGLYIAQKCPGALVYDPDNQLCDMPFNTEGCTGTPRTTTTVTTASTVAAADNLLSPVFDCSERPNGFYANPYANNSCDHIYFACTNGFTAVQRCPANLYFDQDAQSCDLYAYIPTCTGKVRTKPWESSAPANREVKLENSQFNCEELSAGNYADPDGIPVFCSSTYYTCVNGSAIRRTCPAGLYFDRKRNFCNFKNRVFDCTFDQVANGFSCLNKQDGVYADLENLCSEMYYSCVNQTAVQRQCPGGYAFDFDSSSCKAKYELQYCQSTYSTVDNVNTTSFSPTATNTETTSSFSNHTDCNGGSCSQSTTSVTVTTGTLSSATTLIPSTKSSTFTETEITTQCSTCTGCGGGGSCSQSTNSVSQVTDTSTSDASSIPSTTSTLTDVSNMTETTLSSGPSTVSATTTSTPSYIFTTLSSSTTSESSNSTVSDTTATTLVTENVTTTEATSSTSESGNVTSVPPLTTSGGTATVPTYGYLTMSTTPLTTASSSATTSETQSSDGSSTTISTTNSSSTSTATTTNSESSMSTMPENTTTTEMSDVTSSTPSDSNNTVPTYGYLTMSSVPLTTTSSSETSFTTQSNDGSSSSSTISTTNSSFTDITTTTNSEGSTSTSTVSATTMTTELSDATSTQTTSENSSGSTAQTETSESSSISAISTTYSSMETATTTSGYMPYLFMRSRKLRRLPIDCAELGNGLHADPDNGCSKTFYYCSKGVGMRVVCPEDLFYDADKETCTEFGKVAACVSQSQQMDRDINGRFLTAATMCSSLPDGRYANPLTACSNLYIICSAGSPSIAVCPKGQFYDQEKRRCGVRSGIPACMDNDRPARLDCSKLVDGVYMDQDAMDGEQFLLCSSGKEYEQLCPEAMKFDEGSKRCLNLRGTTLTTQSCQNLPNGNYANPSAPCSVAYYRCENEPNAFLEMCTDGTVFDSAKGMCQSPNSVESCKFRLKRQTKSFQVESVVKNRSKRNSCLYDGPRRMPLPNYDCAPIYYECIKGRMVPVRCPMRTRYNPSREECEFPELIPECHSSSSSSYSRQ